MMTTEPVRPATPHVETRAHQPQLVALPCGCQVTADHETGERLVVCQGHPGKGPYTPASHWREPCPGGRGYTIRGRLQVVYTASPRTVQA